MTCAEHMDAPANSPIERTIDLPKSPPKHQTCVASVDGHAAQHAKCGMRCKSRTYCRIYLGTYLRLHAVNFMILQAALL